MKKYMVVIAFAAAFLVAGFPGASRAGLSDMLDSVLPKTASSPGGAQALSEKDIASGLKEALARAVEKSVSSLGATGGYAGNPLVKIPLPERLTTVEKGLRLLGRGDLADSFVASMNAAAERAVGEAREVFLGALKAMTVEDARDILNGPDNAATRYFERTTRDALRERFLPIVGKATDEVGVTQSYKSMVGGAGAVGQAVGFKDADLDEYVTGKGLDGLFLTMAEQEKEIRRNPAARTTELLRKVFGK